MNKDLVRKFTEAVNLADWDGFAEIVAEYEGVSMDDVRACLLFATRSLGNTEFMPLTSEGK